jgi:hypothetical protein
MTKRRSSAEVWLIGKGTEELPGSHLPTNADVLRLLMFFHVHRKSALKEAAALAVSKVIKIWQRARIPHQRIDSGVRILMKFHNDYEKLKKSRKRNNVHDQANQEAFKSTLIQLFDMATSDALSVMTIEEDRQFLIMQRDDVFSCSMAGVDVSLTRKEKRKSAREERFQNFAAKVASNTLVNSALSNVAFVPSSSSQSTSHCLDSGRFVHPMKSTAASEAHYSSSSFPCTSDSDEEFQARSPCLKSQPKRAKVNNILTDTNVTAALDRVNVPDRGATFIVGAVAQALGHNVNSMTLSRSSIRRSRYRNRAEEAAGIDKEVIGDEPLLLHWDGKLLPDITGKKETVDRIAVLVTGGGQEILLGVPKIGRGTGKEQAEACLSTLDDWGLRNRVRGIVFDTTASNTGLKNGACTFIETSIDQELAWVACRHHIIELPLAAVFGILFGPTGGPDVALFKRFQKIWPHIDQTAYEVASDDMFDMHTSALREEIVKFCKTALEGSHQREDYEEFLKLCLIFLGGERGARVSFRAPGAFHHARWMAKAIYSIKIFLFQKQFSLTAKEKHGVKELALFVSLVYVRFWHEAPLPIRAPLNDLLLLEELNKYPNRRVAMAASTSFSRHLWYASEMLVGLSLFDDRIGADVKSLMVTNLRLPQSINSVKRLDHPPEPLSSLGLASCFTEKTTTIFDILLLNGKNKAQGFLVRDPKDWCEDPSYQELRTAASVMTVVNDSAERAIALMQQYNSSLTKNEEQKQYLLRLVKRHRKAYPSCSKAMLMKMTEDR